ncbi:N-acetylglucosamine-6-phosphate deacetylase [Ameyamaea chiangmaiensis NBRC 103196]|uniref:N-acetylglucosamine-6-phosphate deacetylase n=1 Tax=Ameyamaea chiangmaiensis TaxID=442969 RepID=A0A850PGP7_9PROT|nr:N-acetylglucosamine-6-phosphate deacetylase [Ameyamaea chiangmaiensis]MBS4074778.1 N-acetylglucosamine-6-phosphate deacetylase [Ameyamaea chiangmaiensis]NVN40341.1 N-acetylglucosamine-6-phosphate deacetylase [Ameyamaea chiangmaiensis]GBQ62707.1 N-acetylglucosamine-6-phosphate deacetylase [Ameyamaea chiangmaiensis NBRC 103196]
MQISGRILAGSKWIDGHVTCRDGLIQSIAAAPAPDRFILPGFIDTHVHGGGGADVMDGADAVRAVAAFHLAHGTTTLLPTTITRPWTDVMSALRAVSEVMGTDDPDGPSIPGVHLEGPFVSPHRLGAQPPFALDPSVDRIDEVLASGVVRVVTLAPELPHADDAMRRFAAAGVRVSLGHTIADVETTERALRCVCEAGGTVGLTHLFNAMNPIEGRRPGPVAALFCHDAGYAEMIFDTHHVHPATFRMAHRVLDRRLLFITDAMRATGQGDGPSSLGGQAVMVRDGVARLPDGTLAGSVLTLDQALRNAVAHGTPLAKAAELVSTNAASYLGLTDRGVIAPGKRADLVVLDASLTVVEVWVAGRRVRG